MKRLLLAVVLTLASGPVAAQQAAGAGKPATLEQLLERVRAGWKEESQINQKREAFFRAEQAQRQKLLKQARAELVRQRKLSETLEKTFDKNESEITRLEETLRVRMGTMGELFGVIRQMAGEAMSQLRSSLVAAQYPGRDAELKPLVTSKGLPTIPLVPVSSSQAEALVRAAEARTGAHPWRRTDLLRERIAQHKVVLESAKARQARAQTRLEQARQRLAQVEKERHQWAQEVAALSALYRARNRPERPHSRLAQARRKLAVRERRICRRQKELERAQR